MRMRASVTPARIQGEMIPRGEKITRNFHKSKQLLISGSKRSGAPTALRRIFFRGVSQFVCRFHFKQGRGKPGIPELDAIVTSTRYAATMGGNKQSRQVPIFAVSLAVKMETSD